MGVVACVRGDLTVFSESLSSSLSRPNDDGMFRKRAAGAIEIKVSTRSY